jgi:hypothetical protein
LFVGNGIFGKGKTYSTAVLIQQMKKDLENVWQLPATRPGVGTRISSGAA